MGELGREDDGVLQLAFSLPAPLHPPGFISTAVGGRTKGPLLQVRQLVWILPIEDYDLE